MKKDVKRLCKRLLALLIVATVVFAVACSSKDTADTAPAGGGGTTQSGSGGSDSAPAGGGGGGDSAPAGGGETSGGGDAQGGAPAGAAGIPELVVCVGPDPDTIDPALNSSVDGATLILHGFEGLYSLDKNGIPVPGQAESVDVSDDGTVYTFHLRNGLKWSDGSPLTASDFVYSWNRAIDPDTAADYEYMFDVIIGYEDEHLAVTAINDLTLEVKLIARTPYFLELTAFPVYYPVNRAVVEANGEAWAINPATYVGNGSYRMVEWVPGSHIAYEKNPNYWNVGATGPERIKFILMDDDNAKLAAYNSGDLSYIDRVPVDEIEALRNNSDFYIEGQLGTYYVSFNVQEYPLNDVRVREALTLAIDRDFITKNIGQAGQINAAGFVAEGISDAAPGSSFRAVGGDYYDPSPAGYQANLARAKALIEEVFPDGKVPTMEYIYNTSTGHQLIAEALQSMWASIGVNVTLESQEWAVFLNTRKNGEYQIARNGWLNDYNDPIGMLDMWVTDGGNNDAQWSNARYDELIAQVKSTPDQAQRMKMMHEMEDIIFDEWMLAPIYFYVDYFMLSDNIKGFFSSPLGYKYFMYAYE